MAGNYQEKQKLRKQKAGTVAREPYEPREQTGFNPKKWPFQKWLMTAGCAVHDHAERV
jgi:hypothetical protein